MRKPQSSATGRAGVNYVRSVVEAANCVFHEVGSSSDFGLDAFVELVENEEMTGVVLALQIKSGTSYISATSCTIPATRGHLEYWKKLTLPVIGVVFDPVAEVAYWTDISEYLSAREIWAIPSSSITFRKSRSSQFDFFTFKRRFLVPAVVEDEVLTLDQALAAANSSEFTSHVRGMRDLLRHHRNQSQAWDTVIHHLRAAPFGGTSAALIQQISFVLGNPDIFALPRDLVPHEVEAHVREQVRTFSEGDVAKLLSRVESDGGFARGSIGQAVEIILRAHPRRVELVKSVVDSEELTDDTRVSALLLLVRFQQQSSRPYLVELAAAEGNLGVWARECLQHLESQGEFH